MNEHKLYEMPKAVYTFWASAENPDGLKGSAAKSKGGRKGNAYISLEPGDEFIMAHADGPGVVRRIWVTINNRTVEMMRGLKLQMFWDQCDKPAVQVPIGDFFCNALGRATDFDNIWFSNPEGRSFNCFLPMPFKKGMKITITNETPQKLHSFYYEVDYTLGDDIGGNNMYLHAYFNRENPTTPLRDYAILPEIHGTGRYLGCNVGVISNTNVFGKTWWGEGEVKIFLDGDMEYPTLCGTGTEDYIGTGWELGKFHSLYQGCTVCDKDKFQFGFYRLHKPDPVYFYEDIKVTIQQIGSTDPYEMMKILIHKKQSGIDIPGLGLGKIDIEEIFKNRFTRENLSGLFERYDDWSSTAYFYLTQPENSLPELISYEERK